MKKHLKSIISLTSICAVVAILMSITNYITAPIITEQENKAANEALYEVMPNGKDFSLVDISSKTLPETVKEVYGETGGGYVFKLETTGYSSGFIIMCGVDANGTVTGTKCIASSETLGEESTYGANLVGKTVQDIDAVDTVGGATKTTGAYKNAVKDALNAVVILGGGSVDLRSEEEILADNLNTVLPDAQGKFTPLFVTEELSNSYTVYKADNDKGYVFVSGDNFIATDNNGVVLTTDAESALKDMVEADAKILLASKVSELDVSSYEMPTGVLKAYKTESGNYVFELRAAGFGINGDHWYNPSGEYIYIKVSATAKGKIIACETTKQSESDGIGSVCGDREFYSQFNGKTNEDYKDIDAISGATITTNGYKTAIGKVFEAINILEGGN